MSVKRKLEDSNEFKVLSVRGTHKGGGTWAIIEANLNGNNITISGVFDKLPSKNEVFKITCQDYELIDGCRKYNKGKFQHIPNNLQLCNKNKACNQVCKYLVLNHFNDLTQLEVGKICSELTMNEIDIDPYILLFIPRKQTKKYEVKLSKWNIEITQHLRARSETITKHLFSRFSSDEPLARFDNNTPIDFQVLDPITFRQKVTEVALIHLLYKDQISYATEKELKAKISHVAGRNYDPIVSKYKVSVNDQNVWYLNYVHAMEKECANMIQYFLKQPDSIVVPSCNGLNTKQNDFMKLRGCIKLLTGKPGTGKTHTISNLVNILISMGKNVHVCAISSVAAYVLHQKCPEGTTWSTCHRYIFNYDDSPFLKRCHVLICDELSMCNLVTFHLLLLAAQKNKIEQIIFVGDANQLPSIQHGAVLRDIQQSNILPHVELDEIIRQMKGSYIIKNAHRMLLNQPFLNGHDFHCHIVEKDPYIHAFEYIKMHIDKKFTVICFVNMDVSNANQDLQDLYNSDAKQNGLKFNSKYCSDFFFRDGDPVYFLSNKYAEIDKTKIYDEDFEYEDTSIYLNGEKGEIEYTKTNNWFVNYVHNNNETPQELTLDLDIAPSYASNVWKLQGSQFEHIVIILQGFKCSKSALYTSITRGSKSVNLFTTKQVLDFTLRNDFKRPTRLQQMLMNH